MAEKLVKMFHPEVANIIEQPASAVPSRQLKGWKILEDEPTGALDTGDDTTQSDEGEA